MTLNTWTEAEVQALRDLYPHGGAKKCREKINRAEPAIRSKANSMGIHLTQEARERISVEAQQKRWENARPVVITCLVCGKEAMSKHGQVKFYCDWRCKAKAERKREREGRVRHKPRTKSGRPRFVRATNHNIIHAPIGAKSERLIERRLDELFGVRTWQ
jgi:ribosomal protein L18